MVVLPRFLPRIRGLTMAYTERRARKKGVRYRGMYKDANGRYKSAGTYDTDERGRCRSRWRRRNTPPS